MYLLDSCVDELQVAVALSLFAHRIGHYIMLRGTMHIFRTKRKLMVFSLMIFSDEPVTEAYVFLGIPLGRGTRRNGECMSLSLDVCTDQVALSNRSLTLSLCCLACVFSGLCLQDMLPSISCPTCWSDEEM